MSNNTNKQQHSVDEPLWQEAQTCLEQQPLRQKKLETLMQTKPSSGLYQDEDNNNLSLFPSFVRYVRIRLSQSPRTILWQATNQIFQQEICCTPDFKHLQSILGIIDKKQNDLCHVANIMRGLSEGRCYSRLEKIKRQQKQVSPQLSKDRQEKIIQGLIKRAKKKNTSPPSLQDIHKVLDRVRQEEVCRQKCRLREIESLERKLTTDAQYLIHCQATELWQRCGAKNLWSNYKQLDRLVCQRRGERGNDFEDNNSKLCYAMIAMQLSKQHHDNDPFSFSFQRNLFWWHNGQKVGEIDLVIFNQDEQVAAICEMKSSCFEIAMAARQHERKLEQAAQDCCWAIGQTAENATQISPRKNRIHLFVAALLQTDYGDQLLGVEPALANAICEGIRRQKQTIAHPSTLSVDDDDFFQPLMMFLRNAPSNNNSSPEQVERCIECLDAEDTSYDDICISFNDNNIDLDQLKTTVVQSVGSEQLRESPVACLRRLQQNGQLLLL